MSDSSPSTYCQQCGAATPNAPEGLCPRCLMVQVMQPTQPGDAAGAMPPFKPEEIAPHFPQLEILECLGRGGMGVVYKARQKSLKRLVALKLLAPERADDPQFEARFEKEAHALAALNHPHIVGVYDFGQAGGFYFLLMEFVDGVNLRQLLQAKRLTPKEALSIVPPVCEALQCAHEHGIVHRDIKPENLLIDKAGKVKIADFGVAKMLGSMPSDSAVSAPAPEAVSQAFGTPDYAAPEQANGQADHRADIYSLGVVLYEMLTGERPTDKIVPPSKRVQVDIRIDEVVLRALEKTPHLRFATAAEFRTQVEAVIKEAPPPAAHREQADEAAPVAAQPTNPWPRRLFILLPVLVIVPAQLFLGLLVPIFQSTRGVAREARLTNEAKQREIERAQAADEQAQTATQDKRGTQGPNTMGLLADGFDSPVGAPDGEGYHVSREAFTHAGVEGKHPGEDWDGDSGGDSDLGDPVYAVADGLVMFSKNAKLGHGNVIIVQHNYQEADGRHAVCESSYHHLMERLVETGARVKRGQKIGTLGNNSGMYPSHLHFELRKTPGMGLDQSKFEKSTKNYWRPSHFIREHRPAAKNFSTRDEQWIVEGRVVDAEDKPVADANIHVSAGMGSLHVTGGGKTGMDGRYRVSFGPGFLMADKDRAGALQTALVHVVKDGYAEKNLCETGNLRMAWELTKEQLAGGWQPGPSRTFLPGKPLTVDFVLVPAAQIEGTLLDNAGRPVANREIVLTGDRLGPGGSIHAAARTDSQGRFAFKDVSTQHAWSFSIDDQSGHSRTPPDRFATPETHRITLEADGGSLRIAVIASKTSAIGKPTLTMKPVALRYVEAARARDELLKQHPRLAGALGSVDPEKNTVSLIPASPAFEEAERLLKELDQRPDQVTLQCECREIFNGTGSSHKEKTVARPSVYGLMNLPAVLSLERRRADGSGVELKATLTPLRESAVPGQTTPPRISLSGIITENHGSPHSGEHVTMMETATVASGGTVEFTHTTLGGRTFRLLVTPRWISGKK